MRRGYSLVEATICLVPSLSPRPFLFAMNIFILGRPRYLVAWRGETIAGGHRINQALWRVLARQAEALWCTSAEVTSDHELAVLGHRAIVVASVTQPGGKITCKRCA